MPRSKRHRQHLANYRFLELGPRASYCESWVGRAASYFFRSNPISRAIRFTDPVCRPRTAAISDAARRRAIAASLFRSRSTALAWMISFRDHPAGSTKSILGNFRVATLDGLVQAGV